MIDHIRKFDLFIVVPVIVLMIIGLLMLHSIGANRDGDIFIRQMIWVVISVLLFIGIQYIPVKAIMASAYILFGLNIILLVLVKFINYEDIARWINLGFAYIQPSEFAKFTLTLTLARFLSNRMKAINTWRVLIGTMLITLLPLVLTFIQPDLGTSIIFIIIMITTLYLAGAKPIRILILMSPMLSIIFSFMSYIWIFYLILLAAFLYIRRNAFITILRTFVLNVIIGGISPILWNTLKEYQKTRILAFLNPQSDIHGYGWNLLQSKIAIGSGGILGKGYLHGTQKGLNFIPQQHTDFIFSVVGEELGFLGYIFIILLVSVLLVRTAYVFPAIRNNFAKIAAGTAVIAVAAQMLTNIAMTTGLLPIVGLPLNFISYGGSSLITSVLMIGVLNKVIRERFNYW